MTMRNDHWTPSEKKHARRLFEQTLASELAECLSDFKDRAARAKTADDMWSIRDHLQESQREIERKYDYRYSQLIIVFGRLLREGRVTEEQLAFLSSGKLDVIRRIAAP